MSSQRRICFQRIGVLAIVSLALIWYMHKRSRPQVTHPVKVEIRNELFLGGKAEGPADPVIKDLPPEPPHYDEVVVRPKIKKSAAKVVSKHIEMKLVHLDLKGAPPKVSYYEQVFPLLSKLGANGLLMEYEDMFPFTGELAILQSPYAYSEEDLKKILHLAKINNLEVVPLVQTFGHMEYVLKHDKYRHLREVNRYPNSLNPHRAETMPLVKMILTQVLDKHPMNNWVHIGSDEVYHLGEGQESKSWLYSNKGDLGKMFLSHLKKVAGFLYIQFPKKNLLVWDDMLRKLSIESIQASGITKHVSPVLWFYRGNFSMTQTVSLISKYEKIGFTNIWFASAFKGASGVAQMWTPMDLHMKNHQLWKKVINKMSQFPKIHYSGIALTGWQRYDHYSVLCELLPVGIPSLAVCLKALKYGEFNEEANKDISHILGYSNINTSKNICEGTGSFPGSKIYNMVKKVHSELKRKFHEITEEDNLINGWFSRYHRKRRFGNPSKMERISTKILNATKEWESHIEALRSQLNSIYFPDTVEEWMEENVNPYMDSLRQMAKDFQEILPLNGRPKVLLRK